MPALRRAGRAADARPRRFQNDQRHLRPKAGDDVLKAVATALKGRVRSGDLAARIGGDEFSVLLSNATPEQADAIAIELHRVVRDSSVCFEGRDLHTGSASASRSSTTRR